VFKSRKPTHRGKKELIVFSILASLCLSTIYVYTHFLYPSTISSNLPTIHILCNDEISRDSYVDCIFELDSERIEGTIKLRGATASKYPKKSYRIELSTQKALLGLRKDDDWILFALYNDHQRLNTKLSMDIWNSLEDDNPTAILPKTRYIKLYLNAEFQGLYLLAEKDNRDLFKLDDAQNNIDSSLIFQAKYWTTLNEYDKQSWEQDWPKEDKDIFIMDEIMTELISFINNTPDNIFFDPNHGIYSKFDKLNLIDFYLFNFFIQHKDFWSKNYFIVRQTNPSKFFLIPWDFDSSIGGRWDLYSANENREVTIREKNELFNRLLSNDNFRQDCNNRWIELRQSIWKEEKIMDMLSDNYEEIKDILEIELKMWQRERNEKKKIDVDKDINDLFQWISDRLTFCDLAFSEI